MANKTVTNNPGNRGSGSGPVTSEHAAGERSIQPEGNPVPAGNPMRSTPEPDVADRGKAESDSDTSDTDTSDTDT